MLFWIIVTVLAAGVAAMIALPLWRGGDPGDDPAHDIAIYRDQLAEVERDLARGVLAPDEAARTRTEVARRLLAADRAGAGAGVGANVGAGGGAGGGAAPQAVAPPGLSRGLGAGMALALVVGSGALYLHLGAPGYPDVPLAQRLAEAQTRFANRLPQAEAEAQTAAIVARNRVTPPDDILTTVASLRAELGAAPDDLPTLTLLRDFEAATRNWPEAAALTAQIVALKGTAATADDLTLQLDLMVFATNGYVSAEARAVLDTLADLAPDSAAIAYFEGLVYNDIGRPDLAFGAWRPLAEGESGGVFAERARAMIADTAFAAGLDYTPPQGNQTAQIEGMVAGLAARLASEGGPAEDWGRLILSYGVLGRRDEARAIWAEAQVVFADNPPVMAALSDAAARAGVLE